METHDSLPGPNGLPPHLEARLRAPQPLLRPMTRALLFLSFTFITGLAVAYAALSGGLTDRLPLLGWGAIGALLGLLSAWYIDRRVRVPPAVPPLVLEPDKLILPITAASEEREDVPLEEVESIDVIMRGRRPRLAIGTRRWLYVYPLYAFDPTRAAVNFARAILVAIAALPQGAEQLAQMDRRQQVTLRFVKQQPRATRALLALIFIGFAVQHALGAFDAPFEAAQGVQLLLGANASVLVADGEWWRLFVANFLHGGWVHIGFNCLALLSLGNVLERLVGTPRFVLIYLASAVAGTLASAWAAQGPFSVGASTAIFGLLGAFGVMSWRFGPELPAGVRQTRRWWVVILGVNAALPFIVPVIDMGAHAGGFFGGALVTVLAFPSLKRFDPAAAPTIGIRAASAAIVGVFALAGLRAARYAESPPRAPEELLLTVLAADERAELQNMHAWVVATSRRERPRLALEAARDRAQAVVDEQRVSAYLDTLATTEHRLGNRARAARLEREALIRIADEAAALPKWRRMLTPPDDGRMLYSQLARFLAGPGGDAPPLVTGPVPPSEVQIDFEGGAVNVRRPAGHPLVAFAQLVSGEGPQGVLRVGIAADDAPTTRFEAPAALQRVLVGRVDLHVLWVDTSSASAVDPAELGLEFRRHEPRVDDLP